MDCKYNMSTEFISILQEIEIKPLCDLSWIHLSFNTKCIQNSLAKGADSSSQALAAFVKTLRS